MPPAKGTPGLSLKLTRDAGSLLSTLYTDRDLILGLVLMVVRLAIAYLISAQAAPRSTMCRRCGGTGKVGGGYSMFAYARGFCHKCGATGLVPTIRHPSVRPPGKSAPEALGAR